MRRIGTIPGIYYHKGEEPISISVKELDLRPLIYTAESHIVKLILDGEEDRTCIMKTYDFHPTTDRIVHFDLQGVSGDETVRVEVPVVLKGQSIGVKEGVNLSLLLINYKSSVYQQICQNILQLIFLLFKLDIQFTLAI